MKVLYQYKPEVLYAFLYNPMIHESLAQTVSIHRTREGAEIALEQHRHECEKEWKDIMQDDLAEFPFGQSQDWKIETIEILD